jgi:archaellum biogenesis protein FlaJ (TadC family)
MMGGLPWKIITMLEWIQDHRTLLGWLGAASAVTFLLSLFIAPCLVMLIPADYFTHQKRHRQARQSRHPLIQIIQIILIIAKNLLGVLFVLAGLLMLVLPGQGLMTLLIGIMFLDFPGKYRLERCLVSYPPIFRSINWLRQRTGRAPLNTPPQSVD